MRKVIFLDIDGVLNRKGTKERVGPFIGCDRALATLLLRWLDMHLDVQVVLSSTWRFDTFQDFGHKDHLRQAGLNWVDATPIMNGSRGIEIAKFLNDNLDITRFAILDDMSHHNFLPDQKPFLVQTDPDIGLTPDNLLRLDTIFA